MSEDEVVIFEPTGRDEVLVVRVELHSAISRTRNAEVGRMVIANVGGSNELGDYQVVTYRGRTTEQLDQRQVVRMTKINRHPRKRVHVWNLVAKALRDMGYK